MNIYTEAKEKQAGPNISTVVGLICAGVIVVYLTQIYTKPLMYRETAAQEKAKTRATRIKYGLMLYNVGDVIELKTFKIRGVITKTMYEDEQYEILYMTLNGLKYITVPEYLLK